MAPVNRGCIPSSAIRRSESSFVTSAATAEVDQELRLPRASTRASLAHPEPRRLRDREHVRFVAKQPCLICGRKPSDPHHLRFAQHRALGRKVSDEFTVPLCRGHHREVHRCGDEAAWWKKAGVDPTGTARALWLETHPLPDKCGHNGQRRSSTSVADVGADQRNAKPDRPIAKGGPNYSRVEG